MVGLKIVEAKPLVAGFRLEGLQSLEKTMLAMVVDGFLVAVWRGLIHVGLPQVVGDVVYQTLTLASCSRHSVSPFQRYIA